MSTDDRGTLLAGLAFGALAPIAVALLLVPFRDELANANLALALVVVVVVVAIVGGRRAGAVAAIVATLSFDFFLTRPYLSLKIETSRDLETAVTLLLVGLLVGAVASRGRRSARGRERAAEAIDRVHRVADAIARGEPVDAVARTVTAEVRAVLHLADCWLEFPPFSYVMPVLERGGGLSGEERRYVDGGLTLSEDGVELVVLEQGTPAARFVLVGDPGAPATVEERVVAVALADQLGVALALAGPADRARLEDASRRS